MGPDEMKCETLREAFGREWALAAGARKAGDLERALHHLERAHILGQRRTRLHVQSHIGMLALGWQLRDRREIAGQLTRIIGAALFTWLWVPDGNTGSTRVGAFQPMQIPEDLRAIIERSRRHGGRAWMQFKP